MIAVVDYHKGNLKSVERGLIGVGADARITDDIDEIASAEVIVLPGVGAFTDAAEGSEHYEAVRFVFENGLMAPKAEDAFGVDEEANVGDLTYALCILAGLPVSSGEEAVATLAQYGIVPADVDASTALSMRLNDTIFVAFGQAVGLSLTADEPNETYDNPMTRGELAEQIKLFTDLLQ